jgi:alkylated DNA nucleotide flippase Atl1
MKDVYDANEQNAVCAAAGVDPDKQVTYFTYRDVVASIGENRTPEQVARLLREVDREKWGEILTATGQWAEDLNEFATFVEEG